MLSYKKWLGLVLFIFLATVFLTSITFKLVVINPVYDKSIFKLDKSIDTLVIGASHSATAFNPKYLSNTENVSKSGEPFFFSYYKAKVLLANNPQIRNVVVSISPIHLSKYAERQLFQGNAGSREYAMAYYFLIDNISDNLIKHLSSDNILSFMKYKLGVPFNYMTDLKVTYNYYTNNIIYSDYAFWGGYEAYNGSHLAPELQKDKSDFYYFGDDNKLEISMKGELMIRQLATLVDEYPIKLKIIATPTHSYFRTLTPEQVNKHYFSLLNELADLNANITFHDLSDFELDNDSYLDSDHLNSKGGIEFSKFVEKAGFLKSYDTSGF